MQNQPRTLLLLAGVEGGGVSLYGIKAGDVWQFECAYTDQTSRMLDEEHEDPPILQSNTWEAALHALDTHGWLSLPPRRIHKDFRALILTAIEHRITGGAKIDARTAIAWREACRIKVSYP